MRTYTLSQTNTHTHTHTHTPNERISAMSIKGYLMTLTRDLFNPLVYHRSLNSDGADKQLCFIYIDDVIVHQCGVERGLGRLTNIINNGLFMSEQRWPFAPVFSNGR